MGPVILFLAVVASIAAWWLSQQRLASKPWLEEGEIGDFPRTGGIGASAAKVGLGVFLAVAGCLFSLLTSAYLTRRGMAESNGAGWQQPPTPSLLWFNTGVLAFGSLALQGAYIAARRGAAARLHDGLALAGASALVFLVGQLLVWRQLVGAGYFAANNPANAFFYLLTGIHGLHVAGGLAALAVVYAKMWRGLAPERMKAAVGMCAAYWHFLLLVWLLVLALLVGWANDFIVICHALAS